MKKVWLFCVIALAASLCCVMAIPQLHPAQKLPNHYKKIREEISYCAWLRKNDKMDYDNLEQSLATIYYYKGDKETAYQYIINQTDYAWKVYTANAFSEALTDFEYAYPIATDTVLEKIINDRVSDYYLQQDFPQASAGLKMIMLHYRLSKSTARYSYDTSLTKDKQQLQLLGQKFIEERQEISKKFLDLLHDHGRFYTYKEAGNGYRLQYSLAETFGDSTFHAKLQPYYEKSFRNGDISQESYVDELMKSSGISVADTLRYQMFKDSLCRIYKCRPMIRNVTRFNNGDSLVFYEIADRPGSPQPRNE
jgi:hypothetical protein